MLVTALMSALVVALGLTPAGFVPVPTPAGAATTIHIPVILAALAEGPAAGAVTGLLFGAFSFWRAITAAPNPIARMMFSDPLVAFGPASSSASWHTWRCAPPRAAAAGGRSRSWWPPCSPTRPIA
ncbi:MAG: ECF transporter S component [Limnochordaceae bacterium]|nr:ECF transporter S component [Limnochordaceae bacterium]